MLEQEETHLIRGIMVAYLRQILVEGLLVYRGLSHVYHLQRGAMLVSYERDARLEMTRRDVHETGQVS